ncbi:hypothetical protein HYY74_05525 [Candidatus Woesearchaeota archaeon]|nr:hypothetical protein [Candidatus Woesearchaeota archaeon]
MGLKKMIQIVLEQGAEISKAYANPQSVKQTFHDATDLSGVFDAAHLTTTSIDRICSEIFQQRSREFFPQHVPVDEEKNMVVVVTAGQKYLISDPVDGSFNLSVGIQPVCTILGESLGQDLTSVTVYIPHTDRKLGELYFAQKGGGAFLSLVVPYNSVVELDILSLITNAKRLKVSSETDIGKVAVNFESTSDYVPLGEIYNELRCTSSPRYIGSSGAILCQVAEGRYGVYAHNSLEPWDTLPQLLVTEAGGVVWNFEGQPWKFKGYGVRDSIIAAANGDLYNAVLNIIRPSTSNDIRNHI